MYVGKSERTKGVTWGGGGEESWIDVSQKEIIALLFLFIFLSLTHSSGSCSLCPILSGVRPPDLVTLTERSKTWGGENDKRRQEVRWEERKKNWAPPLLYSLHHSLFLSALLSRVLIITRFCVTGLNKALPCLDYFLPASVDVHAFVGFNHN